MNEPYPLPREWRWVRLGDVLTRIDAGASPKALPRPAADGERGVLKVSAVTWGVFRPDENKALPPGYAGDGVPTVSRGDILISRANTTQLVGALARADQDHPELLLSDKILKLVPASDTASGDYLLRVLRLPHVRELYESRATGTSGSMRNISQATIREALVPLPALAEQRRIARILDQADALRRQRREALALTETFLRSAFLEMFGAVAVNDRGWSTIPVGDAGDVLLGRMRAPKYQSGEHTTPYLRVANVYEDRIDLSDLLSMDFDDEERKRYALQREDILLNEGQSTELVGRPAMWHDELPLCCFQNSLVRFRADRRIVLPEFALSVFLQYLRGGVFAKASSKTSSVAHLSAGRFSRLPMPIPPIGMQLHWESIRKEARRTQQRMGAAAAHTDALFESLQQRAFRGDL